MPICGKQTISKYQRILQLINRPDLLDDLIYLTD